MFSSKIFQSVQKSSIFAMLALLVAVISVVRICASYHEISQTSDESSHIAPGMQLIDKGQFTYELHHPPLARMATAILPYLDGARSHGDASFWTEGNDIINGQGTYWRTLTLARLGILPFYIIGVFLLWLWTRKLYGDRTAFLAVLCYTLIPPVLAHAGVATTDMAATAGVLASSYALWWWLRGPTWQRSIAFGLVAGLSAATKVSFITFFPVAAFAILLHQYFASRKEGITSGIAPAKNLFNAKAWPRMGVMILIAIISAWMALWSTYGFTFGPLPSTEPHDGNHAVVDPNGAKYPAPEYFAGISAILNENHQGHAAYFMGESRLNHGSPLFFPVALAVKTPLAILLLAALAAVLVFYKSKSKKVRDYLAKDEMLPLLITATILLSVLPSNINVGVRHILPIYPFISMLAAIGAARLWEGFGKYGKPALALLLIWMALSSFSSDPDHLSYFNELASASSPTPVLLDSDLDWGQDLDKLGDTLRARGIQRLDLVYFGHAELGNIHVPAFALNQFAAPNMEWVAISKMHLYVRDGYAWLRNETPTARIGNSILLYHFTGADIARISSMLSGGSGEAPPKVVANVAQTDVSFAEALATKSPAPENFLNLSLAYYKAKRFNECITAARKVIALNPNSGPAYNNICAANNQLGNFEEARKAGEQAVRLQPDNQLAKNNLKWAVDNLNKK